mmetsp:Transcript_27078/g.71372  ORF Transcript_27078/g.71372 Transcript_27078/m.71372 type:complete len:241 (+) Transcript_27078:418-1140(+)
MLRDAALRRDSAMVVLAEPTLDSVSGELAGEEEVVRRDSATPLSMDVVTGDGTTVNSSKASEVDGRAPAVLLSGFVLSLGGELDCSDDVGGVEKDALVPFANVFVSRTVSVYCPRDPYSLYPPDSGLPRPTPRTRTWCTRGLTASPTSKAVEGTPRESEGLNTVSSRQSESRRAAITSRAGPSGATSTATLRVQRPAGTATAKVSLSPERSMTPEVEASAVGERGRSGAAEHLLGVSSER